MIGPERYVVAIEVLDGSSVLRFRLRHPIVNTRLRMWIAERAFRFGAWVIGAEIRLKRRR